MTSIRAKLAKKEHKFSKDVKICNLSTTKNFMQKGSVSDSLNPDPGILLYPDPHPGCCRIRIQTKFYYDRIWIHWSYWIRIRTTSGKSNSMIEGTENEPCWFLRWTSNLVPSTGMGVSRSPRLKAASMLKLSSHPKGFHISGSWRAAQLYEGK